MKKNISNFFASTKGVIITGVLIGALAVTLQKLGNPANMGVCVACFLRDITGSLGLHRAAVVQYIRPEIIGIILGATLSSFLFGEFKARTGSMPIVRFLFGAFAMIGALVFLGCPWRTLLRIAGGDINALIGLAGLVCGIFIGTRFFAAGYNPGRSSKSPRIVGLIFPILALATMALVFVFPQIDGESKNGIFFYSVKGPGLAHAPLLVSLAFGLIIGLFLQRSRFCTIGGFRDLILFKQMHLISGAIALVITALLLNLVLGQFNLGYTSQPIAHTMALWNFLGMVLAGLCFTLAGGCPGRQCVLAGEGDGDSAIFILGMMAGAACAHNFGLAASPKGVGLNGQIAVVLGLVVVASIGLLLREK